MEFIDNKINEMTDRILRDEIKSTLEILTTAEECNLTLSDVIKLYQDELNKIL